MNAYLIIILILLIYLLPDWYAFRGVKTLTKGWRSRSAARAVSWAYWLISIGLIVALAISFLFAERTAMGVPAFSQWVINSLITLFVTKLVFVFILFAEDIYRIIVTAFRAFKSKGNDSPMPERRKFISQLGLVVAGIPFVSFIYGVAKGKYDYKVHRQTIYFDDLPDAFDGFTITQLSDIHSGSFDNPEAVQRGIDIARAQKSDLFVFTGDLVNNIAGEIVPWVPFFKQLQAPFGQFSILGNHDYGEYVDWNSPEEKAADFEKLKQQHTALGYRLLMDEHITIEKEGQKIELLGVENWGNGFIQKGDLDKALSGAEDDSFKILLSHDPSHWEEKVKHHPKKIQLTLSGHTHGMQFGIETPTIQWSPVQFRYPHWAGLKKENGRNIYINRGFGFIGFTGRVGIWPEITVLELRKERA